MLDEDPLAAGRVTVGLRWDEVAHSFLEVAREGFLSMGGSPARRTSRLKERYRVSRGSAGCPNPHHQKAG